MSKPEKFVYLRHPISKRVLALVSSNATAEFLHNLQRNGYLLATVRDYEEQEEALWLRQQRREMA